MLEGGMFQIPTLDFVADQSVSSEAHLFPAASSCSTDIAEEPPKPMRKRTFETFQKTVPTNEALDLRRQGGGGGKRVTADMRIFKCPEYARNYTDKTIEVDSGFTDIGTFDSLKDASEAAKMWLMDKGGVEEAFVEEELDGKSAGSRHDQGIRRRRVKVMA